MRKDKLKKLLKPLIKECINEILIERGLGSIINETRGHVPQAVAAPRRASNETTSRVLSEKRKRTKNPAIEQMRRDIKSSLGTIGGDFDPFKGTKPLIEKFEHPIEELEALHEVQSYGDEDEVIQTPGVNLDGGLFGNISRNWSEIHDRAAEENG